MPCPYYCDAFKMQRYLRNLKLTKSIRSAPSGGERASKESNWRVLDTHAHPVMSSTAIVRGLSKHASLPRSELESRLRE